jgi:hypothetical protein
LIGLQHWACAALSSSWRQARLRLVLVVGDVSTEALRVGLVVALPRHIEEKNENPKKNENSSTMRKNL